MQYRTFKTKGQYDDRMIELETRMGFLLRDPLKTQEKEVERKNLSITLRDFRKHYWNKFGA